MLKLVLKSFSVCFFFLSLWAFIPNQGHANASKIIFNDEKLCIGLSEKTNKRKAPFVVPAQCDDANVIGFEFNSRKYLEANKLCLDVQENNTLFMYSCSEHRAKEYVFEDGQLKNPSSKLCVGFQGKAGDKDTVLGLVDCSDAPKAEFQSLPTIPVAKIMAVSDRDLPSFGQMPFQIIQEEKDYTLGQVTFLGVSHKAIVHAPGRKNKLIMTLLPAQLNIEDFIPHLDKINLAKIALAQSVINIVLDGAEAKDIDVRKLPAPLSAILKETHGKNAKVDFVSGLTLLGSVDIGQTTLKKILKTFGVKKTNLLLNAKLSPSFVIVDHNNIKAVAKMVKSSTKDIIAATKISLALPQLKLPLIHHILETERDVITVSGDQLPIITSAATLKLPGKKIPMDTQVQLNGDADFKILGRAHIEWKKALGLPFLDLNNIGMQGTVNLKQKDVSLALLTTSKLGRQEIKTVGEIIVSQQGVDDILLGLDGEVELAKLAGINKIPGIKEFSFSDLKVGISGFHGQVEWKRLGLSGSGGLFRVHDGYALMFRAGDLSFDKFIPNLPPMFKDINLPGATVSIASHDLDEAKLEDMPDFMQKILSNVTDDPKQAVPIYNGVGIIAALDEKHIPGELRRLLRDELGVFKTLDGPLVLGGAVRDLFGRIPSIAMHAKLPGFNLPQNQPLSRIINFDKIGGDFFLRLIPSTTTFQVGVGGNMHIAVPQLDNPKSVDKLRMRGEVMVGVDLVSATGSIKGSGQMKGKWNSPLGLSENISIEDPAFVIGVDGEGSIEFGVGGNGSAKVSTKRSIDLEMDMLVNLTTATRIPLPKKLGIRVAANESNMFENLDIAQAFFKGVLTGPMANVVLDVLPPNEKKVAKTLQEELRKADTTMVGLLQLDKLPFPMLNYRDVEMMFATPGAFIPGRDKINTFGVVLQGELEVQLQGKTHKIGRTENRITMAEGLILKTDVKGANLGPIKLDDTRMHMVASLSEVPKLELKTGAKMFGARSDLDVNITPLLTTISTTQKFSSLLDFDLKAFAGTENVSEFSDFAKADFRLASSLKSDPKKWIEQEGLKFVKNTLGGIGAAHKKAIDDLNKAKAEVDKLNNTIEEQRRVVRNERRTVTGALNAAKAEVSKIQNHIRSVDREIGISERSIRSCNQNIRICTIWFFGCKRHETIPNLPERAWCEAQNTPHRLNIARLFTEKTTLQASELVAQAALDVAKTGTNLLPIDADPRVAGPIAARDVAQLSLDAAKQAVSGADVFNKLVLSGVNALKVPDSFVLKKGVIRGSLQEAIRGEPVVLEIDFSSFGKSLKERLAFTLTDIQFNAEQLGILALGLVTDQILNEAKKVPIIPHALLAELENVFLAKRREAEERLIKILEANGDIKQSSSDMVHSVAFQIETKRRVREIKEQAQAKKMQALRAKIYDLKAQKIAEMTETFGDGAQRIFISSVDEVSGDSLCLEAKEERNSIGANKLAFETCDQKPAQTFVLTKNGEVRSVGGRCIDPQQKGLMWLYKCTGHPAMKWEIADFRLQNKSTKQCIRGVGSRIKSGTQAEVDRCHSRSSTAVTENMMAGGNLGDPVYIRDFNDKTGDMYCLEVTSETNSHGSNRLVFNTCAPKPSQAFYYNKQKQIVGFNGRCIDPQAKDVLWLHDCNDSQKAMKWGVDGNHFKNQRLNTCIRALGSGERGASAELDSCGPKSALSTIGVEFKRVELQFKQNGRTYCLGANGIKNSRGAEEVAFSECSGAPTQNFALKENGQLVGYDGRCVDYQERNLLYLYKCTGDNNMKWQASGDMAKNLAKGQCIRPYGAEFKSGAHGEIASCNRSKAAQITIY